VILPIAFLCLAQSGAVASAETHATQVGADILEAGGNAVDAAIATYFALAVTWPTAGNLGGGGFMLYRDPQSGEVWFLDFREVAPLASHPNVYLDESGKVIKHASTRGWKAAGVPGSVPGMFEAHRRWGTLPWAQLLASAIQLAEQGIPVSASEARRLRSLRPTLSEDPFAAKVFYPHQGAPLQVGERLVQKELANTLRVIAQQGGQAFRRGDIVDALVARSQEMGGLLSARDFEEYQAVLRPVQTIQWRGLTIYAPTAPSSGGVFLAQVFATLSRERLLESKWKDPLSMLHIAEVEAHAFSDRNRWLGDPSGFDFDVSELTSSAYLSKRKTRLFSVKYTPPHRLESAPWIESDQTTHLSLIDSEGGAVSITTTLNSGYGAKVMAPGGFLMNNEMDDFANNSGLPNQFGLLQGPYNKVIPGRRPLSSMCPVIVVDSETQSVDAVLGSPGGPTILTTVLQVLLNRYSFGMSPEAAVSAPRFHRQDRPPHLLYEVGRLSFGAASRLRQEGQPLKRVSKLGDVSAIFMTEEGTWLGVRDARNPESSAISLNP